MASNVDVPTIMLVERDEVTLALYGRELSKSFSVLSFTETTGILNALTQRDVRAVLIEPEIGNGQGWALIRTIRATEELRHIPVIVCTTRDAAPGGPGLEVNRYLTKPVLPQALRTVTLEVLRLREAPQARP